MMPVNYESISCEAFNVNSITASKSFRSVIDKLPVSEKDLVAACNSPIAAMKPSSKKPWGNQQYINSASIEINGRRYTLSYHLICDTPEGRNCTLNVAFIVTDDVFDDCEQNPVNLFMACLDKYGVDIEIAGESRRVYEQHSVQLDKSFQLDANNIGRIIKPNLNPNSESIIYNPIMLDLNNVLHMEFLYGFNATQYLADVKRMIATR